MPNLLWLVDQDWFEDQLDPRYSQAVVSVPKQPGGYQINPGEYIFFCVNARPVFLSGFGTFKQKIKAPDSQTHIVQLHLNHLIFFSSTQPTGANAAIRKQCCEILQTMIDPDFGGERMPFFKVLGDGESYQLIKMIKALYLENLPACPLDDQLRRWPLEWIGLLKS